MSFEIIDSDTVKALINDPYILARATDMMQIQLKLFPDEASIERHEGSFAFKMEFYGEDEPRNCNVYPQTCRIESNGDGNWIIDEEILGPNGAAVVGSGIADDMKFKQLVDDLNGSYGCSGDIIAFNTPVVYDGYTISECVLGYCDVIYDDIKERAFAAGETDFYGYFSTFAPNSDANDITEEMVGTPVYIYYVADIR